ncbi:unnamed protein product [Phyllotreta striolata]|uniref:Uncharacterized protein n=1 Tax=Phyllotreta striolata TaxID=444603 RepID=A0A9N9XKD2_PHYSR|nr:unnamed protein product [Phyllotreta striolata]
MISNQPNYVGRGNQGPLIDETVTRHLNNEDVLPINFLYQNFKSGFKGSILNEERGFNFQTQISTFLYLTLKEWSKPAEPFFVLIITPDHTLEKWKEILKKMVKIKTVVIDQNSQPEESPQQEPLIFLISFTNIKLVEVLVNYKLSTIVIDKFDRVANKLIIRKLKGDFHVGLTRRNFYIEPDQKLQWNMLNWVQQGCVGRKKDFFEIDNDNFANMRDNYHHFWLNLTWDYCESFKRKPDLSDDESEVINKVKRKRVNRTKKLACKSDDDITENRTSEVRTETIKTGDFSDTKSSSSDSDDTVEYNADKTKYEEKQATCTDNEQFLLSIMRAETTRSSSDEAEDYKTQVELKKMELYSLIYDDAPPKDTSGCSEADEFLQSLLNSK